MGRAAQPPIFSAADYLVWEAKQPERHEYIDGEVFAMAGAEDRHVTATMNLAFALRQYQLRCPQDVAVVTCDDHAWMDSFTPRLTTINFPKYELGFEAARVLLERLDDRDRPLQALELKSALSIRESCGYQLRVEAKP